MLELPDGRRMTLVAASREAIIATAAQIDGYADQVRPLRPGEEPSDDHLWATVEHAVRHIEGLIRGHDAFDVMAMLQQYMVPADLAVWSESGSSLGDAWSSAEVVALVLLGLGLPARDPALTTKTAAIIPELVTSAAAVVHLASVRALVRYSQIAATEPSTDGLSAIAFRLSTHETSVRGRQYQAVAERINDAVLRTPRTDDAFRYELGFTYDDVLAVREALIEIIGRAHEDAYATLARAAQAGGPPDAEAAAAVGAIFETPGRLQITPEEISNRAGIAPEVTTNVLDRFSIQPDGRTPSELVRAFVSGRNPMAGVAMLHEPTRCYLPLPGALALDEIRRTCEAPLKATGSWTSYGRARDKATETLVAETLGALVGGRAEVHHNLRYRDPQNGHDLSAASTVHSAAPSTEADCLLVLDGVALCVEVKAGDLRPRTRQGGLAQLEGDLTKTIKDAAHQADRLRSLIVDHNGLWRENGSWLDLTAAREVHSIVVCLDDLGPLAMSTSEMVRAGVLSQTHLPWVVSLHDLLVFQHVLTRPEHLLTYVRRRTNRDAALWVPGSDELDILMWFVAGGFYFVPDPDRIHAQHPGSKPPTSRMRREYREQGRTQVGTFTDSLDAHYYWLDGTSSCPAECPQRGGPPPALRRLLDAIRDDNIPGWWRAASDVDGYSTRAQADMAAHIEHTLARTASDGGFHSFSTGGADDTGRWVHIFASGPDTQTNRDHLQQYLAAKKHQDHADRALAVLINPDGTPQFTQWLAYSPREDTDLDRLARAMRLVPPSREPSASPPKAKARVKASRGARRKSRRRL